MPALLVLALLLIGLPCAAQTPPPVAAPAQKPGAPPKAQPSPIESRDDDRVVVDEADLLRLGASDVATLTGHVVVRYRAYTLASDKATVDTDSGVATFDGHVRLDSSDQSAGFESQSPDTRLVLNLKTGDYAIHGAESAVIAPTLLTGTELLLPLRMRSDDYDSKGGIIDARNAGFTTCDFDNPHYEFVVSKLTIVPGKHLIARNAILYRRGKRIFEFRELVLPISNRNEDSNYMPTVGNAPGEGNFVNFRYPYALAALATGILHLDYAQLLGTGTGFDQNYVSHGPGAGGTLSLYELDDKQSGLQSFTGTLAHRQSVGSVHVTLNTQYEDNSYTSSIGASQNLTNSLNISQSSRTSQTAFTSTLEQSNYGAGLSTNLSSSLSQQQTIGKNEIAGLKLNFASFTTPGYGTARSVTSGSLSSAWQLHLQPDGLKVEFETDQFTTIGGANSSGGSSFEGLERRPEVLLTTTGIGDDILDRIAEIEHGSQIQLGLGSYLEGASKSDTDRLFFSYDDGAHSRRSGLVTTTTDSSYQQSFYGDGGARYILNGKYDSDYKTGPFKFGADYSTLRAYGFTPFLFDASGDYNNANLNMDYAPNKAVDFTAATAYDFLRDQGEEGLPAAPWENLLAVLNVHPSPNFVDRMQATYDPNHNELFDLSDDLQAKNSAGFDTHLAFDYLEHEHSLGVVNGSLDLPIITDSREQSGYKVQAMAGYNGITKLFSYQGLALTRSWHDWELTGTYQNNPEGIPPGHTFYITFHLKAFPAYQPFGVGAYGQGLASGIGQIY
jgi:hypothetical protein